MQANKFNVAIFAEGNLAGYGLLSNPREIEHILRVLCRLRAHQVVRPGPTRNHSSEASRGKWHEQKVAVNQQTELYITASVVSHRSPGVGLVRVLPTCTLQPHEFEQVSWRKTPLYGERVLGRTNIAPLMGSCERFLEGKLASVETRYGSDYSEHCWLIL